MKMPTMPSGASPEASKNVSQKDEGSHSPKVAHTIDSYFTLRTPEEITPRVHEAREVIESMVSLKDEPLMTLQATACSIDTSIVKRLHAIDILELVANICRQYEVETPELALRVRQVITDATKINEADNFIVGGTLEYLAALNNLDTDPLLHNVAITAPAAHRRAPVDVLVKRSINPTEDESFKVFEFDGDASRISQKFNLSHQRRQALDLSSTHARTLENGDDTSSVRRMHQEQLSDELRLLGEIEQHGSYVPITEYREFQSLLAEPGVNLTPEEYEAIIQSEFMNWSTTVVGVDWSALTLREQVYALSYLKSVQIGSEDAALVIDFITKRKEAGLAAFQIAAAGFTDFKRMMHVLTIDNQGFSDDLLRTFRTLSNAADEIDAELGGTRNTGVPVLTNEEVQNLRKKMLLKGTRLLRRYIKFFEYTEADEENLSDEQIQERLPVMFGGNAHTPFTAALEMKQEIESIRADAEVYAEFILQEYREDPDSIHEVLRTDFRTLSPEEIAKMELDLIRVLKANRERYITDELELAKRILEFRESLHHMQTDPSYPVQLQILTFKDNLIGFGTIEPLGNPSEKRVRIDSFSLEPDVQHPIIGHAHIQKIVFDLFGDHIIEGEVHRNNPRLLNMYVKQYGFEITGTMVKDGNTYTTVRRLPKKSAQN